MTPGQVTSFLLIWGLIGCFLFGVLVVILFRTGIVYMARKADGTLREEISWSGRLSMLIVPESYFVFLLISNRFGLVQQSLRLNYWHLFLLNYGVYLVLFLFDTFFIDGFVLSIWRPAFLHLPDEMGAESMKKHLLVSVPVGLVIGAVLTLISSTVSYFLWMS
jgi:hypothetical protein